MYLCVGWLVGKSPRLTRLMQLEGFLAVLAGVYCTLLGFGVVAPAKDPEYTKQWRKKFGTFMKISGPFMILFGFVKLLIGLLK